MVTTVTLTDRHIERGCKRSCESCPIALALWDVFPKASMVFVDNEDFSVRYLELNILILRALPKDVQKFIRDFDAGREFDKNIEFDVEHADIPEGMQ